MTDMETHSEFYRAIELAEQSLPRGPVNSSAVLQDKNLVLEKASSLLGYQNYLTQARSWKAVRKSVPLAFEREVQAQASQALSDEQAFAAATLRMTKHFKQSGELDRILDTWIAGVKASGPVQVQDLWSDLENDPEVRQLLKDEGLTDDLWTVLVENMKKVDGRLFLQNGKLAAEFKFAGQDQLPSVIFTHSPTGMPRTISELLRRGQFERMVEQFSQEGAIPLDVDVVAGEARDLEIADVMLSGAILSVQGLAQHKRKLQDTGLASYAGNTPILIGLGIAGLIAVIAYVVMHTNCHDSKNESKTCVVATIIFGLAMAALIGGILLLTGAIGDYLKAHVTFPTDDFQECASRGGILVLDSSGGYYCQF